MITARLNIDGLEKSISGIERYKKELPACIARAINRSLEMVKTEQIRKTMESYSVQRAKLSSTINIFKSSKDNLTGNISSRGRAIGLDHFKLTPKTRKRKASVKASVMKTGYKALPHAFIAYHSGKLGAFERTGEFGFRGNSKREHIRRLMGPSAPQMLGNLSILEYLQGYADEKFRMRFEHEIDRVIGL
nr:MAG TPA: minor tail protein Z [Caudoviricetes sp.]